MSKKPIDQAQRDEALKITESFIIQAPAGSGKTELLIQRFLALLAEAVNKPEEIIAITFTRKAAGEMRQRILQSLRLALESEQPDPRSHGYQTWRLAHKVLQQNTAKNWQLLENPGRLRIQTIDALCHSLTGQLPVLAKFGSQPEVSDNVNDIFAQAARETLESLESETYWRSALKNILLHLDNDYRKITDLFLHMLACRDQWLPHIMNNNPREALEGALKNVIREQLQKTRQLFPRESLPALLPLIRFAAEILSQNGSGTHLSDCRDLSALPPAHADDLAPWQGIARFLLTGNFQWRKKLTQNEGFPAQGAAKSAVEKQLYSEKKAQALELIQRLSANEALRQALQAVLELPPPAYSDQQWQIIDNLVTLLPVLIAHLNLQFKKYNRVDHTEILIKAQQALGSPENPTDLTLALDYRIRHILVDEFQDTSISQLRLLETLTAGWAQGDGRTLFLVGDPMQSIYRFRKAEVGLFLQARDQGVGSVKLRFLRLRVNFRSNEQIVNWHNDTYQRVFPQQDDLAESAIAFAKAEAYQQEDRAQSVFLHPLVNAAPEAEAATICRIIDNARQLDPGRKIAVLVLARTHLPPILAALQKNQIPYRAVELEPLQQKPVIQDLFALTRALLHPADTIAWYALLRAPWCGLELKDLLALKNPPNGIIWNALENLDTLPLSADARQRLQRFRTIMRASLLKKQRQTLASWIENTWLALGGPACCQERNDLVNAKNFFDCIAELENGGDLPDLDQLENQLKRLTADNAFSDECAVEIMTIHKSKGLEFDVVILPCLERLPRHDSHQLLIWQERAVADGGKDLLLAPIKNETTDPVYDYLRRQEKLKAAHETTRLLYVATTRAKSELHLIGNVDADHPERLKAPSGSLLEKLWPLVSDKFILSAEQTPGDKTAAIAEKQASLRRLVNHWQNPLPLNTESELKSGSLHPQTLLWQAPREQIIGIVTHQLLQSIAENGVATWQSLHDTERRQHISTLLKQQFLAPEMLEEAGALICKALENTLRDPRGLWILQQNGHAEYAITHAGKDKLNHLMLDRTFIENGKRWIIDYKTSYPQDMPLEQFLRHEKNIYQPQLEAYAAAMQAMDNNPVYLGIYFPLIPGWIEWQYK